MTALLTALGLSKTYGKVDPKIVALNDVSFQIEEGTFTVILGPSGAGKTTLLNLLGGMDRPSRGILAFRDINIAAYSVHERTKYRREKVGFVFQFYHLMPTLTAKENVELATDLCPEGTFLDPTEVLKSVGLGERINNYPSQLSGGEQQRVSIARALAKNPEVILADEPTGALDYQTGKEILSLLADVAHKQKKAVILVTHNSALADMADHLIRIKNGTIVADTKNDHPKDIMEIEW